MNEPLYTTVVGITLSFTTIAQVVNPKIDYGSRLICEQMQEQGSSYLPNIVNKQQDVIYFEKLVSFAEKFIKSQKDLDAEAQRILNENFWDLV